MYKQINGGVCAAQGFSANGVHCGIRKNRTKRDLALIFSETPASAAAWKPWAKMGCLVQDMETYALYSNAAWLSKNALSILTHTDSCVHGHKHLPYENRIPLLENMFTVALDVASQL